MKFDYWSKLSGPSPIQISYGAGGDAEFTFDRFDRISAIGIRRARVALQSFSFLGLSN